MVRRFVRTTARRVQTSRRLADAGRAYDTRAVRPVVLVVVDGYVEGVV
jgi:hypothetical protein